jgi:hypothetical protein
VITSSLVTHTATVTRRGTRTSDAGDTVTSGVYAATSVVAVPCIAEESSGGSPALQQRASTTGGWIVLVNPGLDIRPRDRITLTGATGGVVTAMVTEVRRFDVPAAVAHMRLTCQEVTG